MINIFKRTKNFLIAKKQNYKIKKLIKKQKNIY